MKKGRIMFYAVSGVLKLLLACGTGQPEAARIPGQNEDVLTNFSNVDYTA